METCAIFLRFFSRYRIYGYSSACIKTHFVCHHRFYIVPFGATDNINDYAKAFRLGQEKGYDYFFRMYFRSLCFFVRKISPKGMEPEDIVQDAFANLWHRKATINRPEAIRAYLYTTVHHTCISQVRKRKIVVVADHTELELIDPVAAINELEIVRAEMLRSIYPVAEKLTGRTKDVFSLSYIYGKSDREISKLMQVSHHTVRNLRVRAIAIIRKKLKIM
ncbi:MAG: sigma-70 family RNA polymerase sigma factor [Chitinophagaceae bacterium]